MKRYSVLMRRYKLSPQRYAELRQLCRPPRTRETDAAIREALRRTNPDELGRYIYDYVTRRGCTVAKLKAAGMPCHPHTFAVHKAHFFYEFDRLSPQVGNSEERI